MQRNSMMLLNANKNVILFFSYIYWIDTGFFSGTIYRANMDGSKAKVISGTGFFSSPYSIAIDYASTEL